MARACTTTNAADTILEMGGNHSAVVSELNHYVLLCNASSDLHTTAVHTEQEHLATEASGGIQTAMLSVIFVEGQQ